MVNMNVPHFAMVGLVIWAWTVGPAAAQEEGEEEAASLQLDPGVLDGLSSSHFEVRNLSESLIWEQFVDLSESGKNVKAKRTQLVSQWLAAHQGSKDLEVKMRLERLIRVGVFLTDYNQGTGFLGISFQASQTLDRGRVIPSISVEGVVANTAAEKAGIRMHDHILRFGDLKIRKNQPLEEVSLYLSKKEPGDIIEIDHVRNGKRKVLKVALGERPSTQFDRVAYPEFFLDWWETHRK